MPILKRNKLGQQMLIFKTPEIFEDKINEYLDFLEANPTNVQLAQTTVTRAKIPNLTGLCAFLGCDANTLTNYSKREGYDKVFAHFKDIACDCLIQAGLNGSAQPAMSIFLCKNFYGMKDVVDVNAQVAPQFKPALTAEEILSRIPDSVSERYLTD